MSKIHLLSDDLIGKIAAGEVVERPTSALKELVENSLDAGASAVTAEIRSGGLSFLRVSDNGCGIEESDLRLAFARHATSKLAAERDLYAVSTLGFRGEALASIAAVSCVTLTTRTPGASSGIRITNNGGTITEIAEAACSAGTSVAVSDLFFNTPVRRNFQRKPSAESAAAADLISRFILSRPDVSFRFIADGKTLLHSPGDGRLDSAAAAVFGAKTLREMRRTKGHASGILLDGFIGVGDLARGNRALEYFFVNGRLMASSLLSAALESACRERVMIGKFPICTLHLHIAYDAVDVNVHPNKLEVRFRDESAVRDALFSLVSDALRERNPLENAPRLSLSQDRNSGVPSDFGHTPAPSEEQLRAGLAASSGSVSVTDRVPEVQDRPSLLMEEPARPFIRPEPANQVSSASFPSDSVSETASSTASKVLFSETISTPAPKTTTVRNLFAKDSAPVHSPGASLTPDLSAPDASLPPDLPGMSDQIFPGHPDPDTPAAKDLPEKTEQVSDILPDIPRDLKIFGALFNTYILVEYEDRLLLVDQHAVHERLLFDRLMAEDSPLCAAQDLLVPVILSVSPREQALLLENRDSLDSIGLSVEPFGEHDAAVRSVPSVLSGTEIASFVRDALADLEAGRALTFEKKRARLLQSACKHAVKGGDPLPESMIRHLFDEMISRKVTPTCPHGRPLVVAITHRELDKKFKRIQD